MKIVSCNIRDARADDGANSWQQRRERCARIIRALDADVVCFQEMRWNQRDDMAAALPHYSSYGLPELADAPDAPNTIFWRRDVFACIDSGGYWLSEQPSVPGSRSWGCQSIRLVNFVVLQHSGGRRVRIINTHLDDGSQLARQQQARMLADDSASALDDEVQVLCGDMNCDASNPAIDILIAAGWRDSYTVVHESSEDGITYHAFQGAAYNPARYPSEPQGRIDWIFIRGDVSVGAAQIIRSSDENGYFPSDHYFVSATLSL